MDDVSFNSEYLAFLVVRKEKKCFFFLLNSVANNGTEQDNCVLEPKCRAPKSVCIDLLFFYFESNVI